MSTFVECPACTKKYQLPDAKLGQDAKCQRCGHTFTLSMRMDETRALVAQPLANRGDGEGSALHSSHLAADPPPSAPAEAPLGKLGQYVIKRLLGAGAMGEVYLAHDPALARDVAIKLLPCAVAQDKELLERFLHEARAAARLNHTNVVTVYRSGVQDGRAYIVMQFVDGESLDRTISRR